MRQTSLPEDFERDEPPRTSSDRSFGLVFAGVFLIVGLAPLVHGGGVRWWSLAVALAFLLVAFIRPAILAPLNWVWTRFGLLLHKVMNPLVMGLLFYVALTPMALAMRLAGKDPLRRRFDDSAPSYWIRREPPGPEPRSMSNQF
jgi:hypothetical protein